VFISPRPTVTSILTTTTSPSKKLISRIRQRNDGGRREPKVQVATRRDQGEQVGTRRTDFDQRKRKRLRIDPRRRHKPVIKNQEEKVINRNSFKNEVVIVPPPTTVEDHEAEDSSFEVTIEIGGKPVLIPHFDLAPQTTEFSVPVRRVRPRGRPKRPKQTRRTTKTPLNTSTTSTAATNSFATTLASFRDLQSRIQEKPKNAQAPIFKPNKVFESQTKPPILRGRQSSTVARTQTTIRPAQSNTRLPITNRPQQINKKRTTTRTRAPKSKPTQSPIKTTKSNIKAVKPPPTRAQVQTTRQEDIRRHQDALASSLPHKLPEGRCPGTLETCVDSCVPLEDIYAYSGCVVECGDRC